MQLPNNDREPSTERLLTVKEVAAKLRLGSNAVYDLITSGRLPCHRIGRRGGRLRVSAEDLRAYVQSCRDASSPIPRSTPTHPRLRHLRL